MVVQQQYLEVSERQATTHVIFSCTLHVCYLWQCMGKQEYERRSGTALQVYMKTIVKF